MTLTVAPFGTYAAITEVCIQAAQDEIIATLTELKTLIPAPASAFGAGAGTPVTATSEQPLPHPEFDKMPSDLAERLVAEIDAIIVVIDAAPIA